MTPERLAELEDYRRQLLGQKERLHRDRVEAQVLLGAALVFVCFGLLILAGVL